MFIYLYLNFSDYLSLEKKSNFVKNKSGNVIISRMFTILWCIYVVFFYINYNKNCVSGPLSEYVVSSTLSLLDMIPLFWKIELCFYWVFSNNHGVY